MTVNKEEAKKVVKKMEDHYTRVGQIQTEHTASMSKSPMLQSIIASTVPTPVKEALEAALKDTERLGAAAIHENLVQVSLKARETTGTKEV